MEVFLFCHNTCLPIRFQCLCGKVPLQVSCLASQVATVLSDIYTFPPPLKVCQMSKLIICIYCKLIFFIRIAESFYWALACFYEEVSLAEGCLFASSQRWKVGPLAVRRLSDAGGLPELPCCAPHRHSVTFGQAVGLSAWIVVNFCFYANPVGGGRQDR